VTKISALLTDLYQLTMLEGYYRGGLIESTAVFDLFYRGNPFGGGYAVYAGLARAVDYLLGLSFSDEDLRYLASLTLFSDGFLAYLKRLRFTGDVYSFREGSIIFPEEPLLRVEAPLGQAQLVETALLNIINFQTLIATKASRVCYAAAGRPVVEFGLRRAQGENGALSASRAAFIGGCESSSNVLAGKQYGIPVRGTHAHSWVMAFDDEYSSFKKYTEVYPDASILLVDTYDSLRSGIPNAIKAARELESKGHRLVGVRLDSGDPVPLSREARKMLDGAGLDYVKIVLSNDLDEYRIEELLKQGAAVDIFGVGTRLVAGHGESALPGVYKMCELEKNGSPSPRMKLSDESLKGNLPGKKDVLRYFGGDGSMVCDIICVRDTKESVEGCDAAGNPFPIPRECVGESQLGRVLSGGRAVEREDDVTVIQGRFRNNFALLPDRYKKLSGADEYPVLLCRELYNLKKDMVKELKR